jgi:hypothetical protein
MLQLKHLAFFAAVAVPLLVMNGCFPTDSGDDNPAGNGNPSDNPFIIGDDPENLPDDINTSANTSDAGIDSMFNLLINRITAFEDINSTSDFYSLDFTSLRQGFGAAIHKNPNHVKANAGFIVASILSINGNKDLQKVIDSIDVYINDMDAYYSPEFDDGPFLTKKSTLKKNRTLSTGFLSKTFTDHGILSAGQVLFAETPKVLMTQTSRPSFPRFLTISYIQNMIETGIIPRLSEVIAATQRLRALTDMSLLVTIEGETAEIDAGDIMILEGIVRAARAGFTMLCIYDCDIYSPDGSKDMRWIDDLIRSADTASATEVVTFSINGDTLQTVYASDLTGITSPIADVYRYNLKRSGFLSIRRSYHEDVHSDLKAIPVLIKAGLTAIKNEDDNQDNDLIPSSDVLDMTAEMGEFSQDMLSEGFSTEFSGNFKSPEALMDFISLLLSQPYPFKETIDGKNIEITVDLSKFFTNPASSLKEYWPKYKFTEGSERYVSVTSGPYINEFTRRTFSVDGDYYDSVIIAIPESMIDSVVTSSFSDQSKMYYLKSSCSVTKEVDSLRISTAIQLVDDDNNPINYFELINDELSPELLSKLFPYFNDYTFGDVFPDMQTRQNWIDFFSVFFE